MYYGKRESIRARGQIPFESCDGAEGEALAEGFVGFVRETSQLCIELILIPFLCRLGHVGRKFDPLKLPGMPTSFLFDAAEGVPSRAPPRFDESAHDPFLDYGPQ